MTSLIDSYGRRINYLRISITDNCNLRCFYCTPFGGRSRLSHTEILTYEEIVAITQAAVQAGISKVRVTGGEPLVRKEMVGLCRMLAGIEGMDSLALTTNGVHLFELAQPLRDAGVKRINVSLDTLKPDRFKRITGRNLLSPVLDGIKKAEELGFSPVKINMVVMRGINDDEVEDIARLTLRKPYHVRFIELMPTEGWIFGDHESLFVPMEEIIKRVKRIGSLHLEHKAESFGPARLCSVTGGIGKVGFISPVSRHFCGSCNRLRLTADGKLRTCLFFEKEIDIKGPLRTGASIDALTELIRRAAETKPFRHALKDKDAHQVNGRAMHSIGG
jgi:cyclic pyranopterin phosphate synthase